MSDLGAPELVFSFFFFSKTYTSNAEKKRTMYNEYYKNGEFNVF